MSQGNDVRVLVTGATGFVAHHIIQLLQTEGYRVRGTVRDVRNENKLKSLRNLCPGAKYPLEIVQADLTKDDGWSEAVKDCMYCIHVASPFPNGPPKEDDDLIIPAVEGTKRVLRACANSGTIKRVVLTSSIAAVHGQTESDNRVNTEEDWTDTTSPHADAYAKSKTFAEKAAWDFMRSLPAGNKMELSVVNPSIVLGPAINGVVGTSLLHVKKLMDWSCPLLAKMHIPFCDARDVALAHLRAMILPEAANNRHLIVSDHIWWHDMAHILQKEFSPQGYYISTYLAPYIAVYLLSLIDKPIRLVVPRYDKKFNFSNSRMKDVLKVNPREGKSVILDTAYSLIDNGLLYTAKGYKPRK